MIQSPLLRSDLDDMPPDAQLGVVLTVIEGIEAKRPSDRSHVEVAELPQLLDFKTHLEMNIGRARERNQYIPRGGTVPCPKCGHHVSIPRREQ